eukprot:1161982-Pelagomonas_calceolata.AAC.3
MPMPDPCQAPMTNANARPLPGTYDQCQCQTLAKRLKPMPMPDPCQAPMTNAMTKAATWLAPANHIKLCSSMMRSAHLIEHIMSHPDAAYTNDASCWKKLPAASPCPRVAAWPAPNHAPRSLRNDRNTDPDHGSRSFCNSWHHMMPLKPCTGIIYAEETV